MKLRYSPIGVIALRGGFGNQLFAWAYGQGLLSKGHSVAYDPGNRLGRGFALDGLIPRRRVLPIPALFWRKLVMSSNRGGLGSRFLWVDDQMSPPISPVQNSALTFHWGYWQSMDHFVDVRNHVYAQLVAWLNVPIRDKPNECAIHVRRGDYVSDAGAAAVMGTLPLGYYERSIVHMRSLGYNEFVVYSDDRNWAVQNILPLDSSTRIASTDEASDFSNMARSGALISANSSFSWWAGFLVDTAGGNVVAPRAWFADSRMDSSRLIPDSWAAV